MSVADLVDATEHDRLDEASARDITRALRSRGLKASPSLFSVLADHGVERGTPSAFDEPGIAVDANRLDKIFVRVRPSKLPALGGAVGVAAVAASIGLYRWPPYAVVALAAGSAAIGILVLWPAALDRRLPAAVPRGALFGAGVALMLLAGALVVFVAVRRTTGL